MKKIEHHLEILDLDLDVVARWDFVVYLLWGGCEYTSMNCLCRKKDMCVEVRLPKGRTVLGTVS